MTMKINYYIMPGFMRDKNFKIHDAVMLVCEMLNIKHRELVSPCRSRRLVSARNMCYALVREESFIILCEIGKYFNRDHTTVVHGLSMHHNDMRLIDEYAEQYDKIKFELNTTIYNKKNTNYVK